MLERVREWWQTSDRQTRLIAVASAVGLVIVMIALSFWATQPEWDVLYTGLSPSDSGAIVARLKQAKVPYRLSAGGSTIEVPAQHRDEMLLSLAAEGLPNQGTLGYSRLEKLGFGTTQTVEQETTRIAHEEALQNTISRLQPVAGARVHITPAIDSPFVGEKKPAKASVMVDLKPGQQLTREQIASIVFLVSRSVAGLSPDNVSVVDEYANLLWDGSQASDMAPGVASNKLELERAYAETIQRQLQQQLDAVLGPGKSRLTVTAELDLDREEINQKQIETGPDGQGTPISETRTEETVRGAAPRGGSGAAGVPTYPTAPAGAPGEYKHSSTTTNYEVGQSTIHRVKTPGRVVRMSVAAMEALDLQHELRSGTEGLWRRFFRRAAKSIDIPWQIVVSGDLRFPEVEGKRVPAIRFINAYMARLHRAAHRDAVIARAFNDVAGLMVPPRSLIRPRILWRVLRGNLGVFARSSAAGDSSHRANNVS